LLQSRSRFGEFLMSYTYNTAGQLASFTDGNNHTTSISNYYRGIPQSIAYADGTSQSLTVDDLSDISSITDQAGYTTQYSYNPIGRITGITYPTNDPNGVSWYAENFTYNYVTSAERGIAAGHWDRITTTGNAVTTTYFDADLRPVLSDRAITGTANSDTTTATAYDYTGAKTFASYPVSGTPAVTAVTTGTHNTYDALERLTQTQEDSELGTLTTATAYLSGAGEQVTDPKGNVTTTYYQVFDEPDYKDPISVAPPGGITQSIVRNIYGDPTSITQSGLYGTESDSVTKTLLYDSYYRLCRTTEPESGSTVMAYDAANNLQWSAQGQTITDGTCGQGAVAGGAQTARTYDAMNRVKTITPPTGTQSTSYTYDARGNISNVVSGSATNTFGYNSRNLLTSQTLSVGGYAWGIAYSYDSYGHVSAVGYPASNSSSEGVAYSPDASGARPRWAATPTALPISRTIRWPASTTAMERVTSPSKTRVNC
jgi:YD repeat-containing protein